MVDYAVDFVPATLFGPPWARFGSIAALYVLLLELIAHTGSLPSFATLSNWNVLQVCPNHLRLSVDLLLMVLLVAIRTTWHSVLLYFAAFGAILLLA